VAALAAAQRDAVANQPQVLGVEVNGVQVLGGRAGGGGDPGDLGQRRQGEGRLDVELRLHLEMFGCRRSHDLLPAWVERLL
jgi:hypothetical protein